MQTNGRDIGDATSPPCSHFVGIRPSPTDPPGRLLRLMEAVHAVDSFEVITDIAH
jgi:hypothetical protein